VNIRVYGPSRAYSSFRAITRGYIEGFEANDVRVDHFPTDSDLGESDIPGGSGAEVGILFGSPNFASVMSMHAMHKRRLVMIAPNSNVIPPSIIRDVISADAEFVSPSEWGASVIRRTLEVSVMPEERPAVSVLRHGVGKAFNPVMLTPPSRIDPQAPFLALHITSTAGSRKSTYETAVAFAAMCHSGDLPKGSSLTIYADPVSGTHWRNKIGQDPRMEGRVTVTTAKNTPWADMGAFYRCFDAVIQPSRAEGFGLCGLEALCVGVPAIVTECTGHSEWVHHCPAAVTVRHGEVSDMGEDGDGAEAPYVDPHEIAEAIAYTYTDRNFLRALAYDNARKLYSEWNWGAVVAPWLDSVQKGL
jgi:hypothetical protein